VKSSTFLGEIKNKSCIIVGQIDVEHCWRVLWVILSQTR